MPKPILTETDKQEIIKSDLKNTELAKIYGVSHKTISGVRVKAGVKRLSQGNLKLTAEQIEEIKRNELGTVELSKKFNITPQHISVMKRKLGVSRKKNVFSKTTPEQKLEIINSKLTNVELAKIYGVAENTISTIRVNVGAGRGRGGGGNFKLTAVQTKEILNSDLPYYKLAEIYGIHKNYISRLKRKNGIKQFTRNKPEKVKIEKVKAEKPAKVKRSSRVVTPEVLKIILDPYLSAQEVRDKTNVSLNRIWQVRKENRVKHIKTTVIKKVLPVHADKVKLQASMTEREQNYLLRKKGVEVVKQQILTDAEKVKNGSHKWIKRTNIYGKIEHALIKI